MSIDEPEVQACRRFLPKQGNRAKDLEKAPAGASGFEIFFSLILLHTPGKNCTLLCGHTSGMREKQPYSLLMFRRITRANSRSNVRKRTNIRRAFGRAAVMGVGRSWGYGALKCASMGL